MDAQFSNEKQLLADIDLLREQFPQTQDLYREVCTLLFFRYGMTPTANKLYQLVRKGSMTAPAEALTKFWEDLREKSRVRIEHPDLPEALKTAAGDLTAALWSSAQQLAHDTVAVYQQEAQASMAEAKAISAAAQTRVGAADDALEKLRLELQQAIARTHLLEQKLAAADATRVALDAHLAQALLDKAAYQQRLEDARREFSAELDKLRASAQQAGEMQALRDKLTNAELALTELRQVTKPARASRKKAGESGTPVE